LKNFFISTETIFNFKHLLADDQLKIEIIHSWKYFVEKGMATIYDYVIMTNQVHLIWRMHQQNGKESVGSSFAKFTAHRFKRILQLSNPDLLNDFISTKRDRNYQFWKRDPLAIPLSTLSIFEQKQAYIHNNPIQEKWKLSNSPEEYRWSSAQFYKTGYDEFNFLTNFYGN
jgi:putative transposase